METFETKFKINKTILALGPESAGNFSAYSPLQYPPLLNKGGVKGGSKFGKIYFSENFGDLLEDTNFNKYKRELSGFLKKNKIKPDIILTDLHPLYKTTILGQVLAKKYKARHIQIQHHIAHIFSALGDKLINKNLGFGIWDLGFRNTYGIALDGTGYGLDGKIWGGEVFKISNSQFLISNKILNPKSQFPKLNITRIGHLENQIMIGGDLAVKEPARMLISILNNFLSKEKIYKTLKNVSLSHGRDFVTHSKKFFTSQEFEILYNQLQQNFNCIETSSTGRVLDAVSILLGFVRNERNYKHEPVDLLEKNSAKPYAGLKPKVKYDKKEKSHILQTTPLFEYLIKNINKDKKRLAATAQLYIAEGLCRICQMSNVKCQMFLSGGIANNKIISDYLESKGAYKNKMVPRGDAGISFGQITYFLLTDSRD